MSVIEPCKNCGLGFETFIFTKDGPFTHLCKKCFKELKKKKEKIQKKLFK